MQAILEYPYQKIYGDYYPIIPFYAAINRLKEPIRLAALIDSGANVSLFSKETAHQLGIVITQGKRTRLRGVSGSIAGYEHSIFLDVGGQKLSCTIVFSGELKGTFNLLGRRDFFSNFIVQFNEKTREIKLIK